MIATASLFISGALCDDSVLSTGDMAIDGGYSQITNQTILTLIQSDLDEAALTKPAFAGAKLACAYEQLVKGTNFWLVITLGDGSAAKLTLYDPLTNDDDSDDDFGISLVHATAIPSDKVEQVCQTGPSDNTPPDNGSGGVPGGFTKLTEAQLLFLEDEVESALVVHCLYTQVVDGIDYWAVYTDFTATTYEAVYSIAPGSKVLKLVGTRKPISASEIQSVCDAGPSGNSSGPGGYTRVPDNEIDEIKTGLDTDVQLFQCAYVQTTGAGENFWVVGADDVGGYFSVEALKPMSGDGFKISGQSYTVIPPAKVQEACAMGPNGGSPQPAPTPSPSAPAPSTPSPSTPSPSTPSPSIPVPPSAARISTIGIPMLLAVVFFSF